MQFNPKFVREMSDMIKLEYPDKGDFIKDEITKAVIFEMIERSKKGYKKYGTTLHENNHQNMLQHMYEEALDFAQYLKKEILTLNTVQDLTKQYSNDAELGKAIREKYGKK
jgi:DNA-directed RNA polymerase